VPELPPDPRSNFDLHPSGPKLIEGDGLLVQGTVVRMIPFRRFQFSLRTMFFVVTLLAVSCGIVIELERERMIRVELENERVRELIRVLTRRIPPGSQKEIKIKPWIP
jgi:translation initiation factor IF-1